MGTRRSSLSWPPLPDWPLAHHTPLVLSCDSLLFSTHFADKVTGFFFFFKVN